jgi:hypothetical protein
MKIIIMTNDPSAREVFDGTLKSNAALVMDFRHGDTVFSRPNGLTYSLGIRYCQLHHHFFPAAVIRRAVKWTHPYMPMIVIVNPDAQERIHALRSVMLKDYPLTEFVMQSEPCAA